MSNGTVTILGPLSSAPQICPKCGSSDNPFYASQNRKGAWCIPCFQAINRARGRAVRAKPVPDAPAPSPALALIRAKPSDERTQHETLLLLRDACPPGRKICGWCWNEAPLKNFHLHSRNHDGHHEYCPTCRTILRRLAQYESKRKEEEATCILPGVG